MGGFNRVPVDAAAHLQPSLLCSISSFFWFSLIYVVVGVVGVVVALKELARRFHELTRCQSPLTARPYGLLRSLDVSYSTSAKRTFC